MAYIGVSPSNGVRQKHTYTATASQTTFSGAGAEGVSLSYRDSNYVDVYRNGVKLGDADYTATSGTSIVLGEGAAVSDIIEIIVYDVFSVADTVSKADGGVFDGNVTMAGTLAVTGETTLSANLNLGDNDKAIFGAGDDLEIYHSGTASIIKDGGQGSLFIAGASDIYITDDTISQTMARFTVNGASSLSHSGSTKLFTTSTGIDVTGTVVSDGMSTNTGGVGNFIVGDSAGNSIGGGANYNTLVGDVSGYSLTNGDSNVALGYAALNSNTTASNNTAVGFQALTANTTGDLNTAVGQGALYANTTGVSNTGVGVSALGSNTTGNYSVAVGQSALLTSSTGSYNTAVGYGALELNTTASYNTAVGYQALYANTTGAENSALGQVSLSANTTGGYNTAVGRRALQDNTTASYNTAVGWRALQNATTGGGNTAIGRDALSSNTTGYENSAVGIDSLLFCTTGIQNVAIGYVAGRDISTGSNNIALGYNALRSGSPGGVVTTGSNIVGIGGDAISSFNCQVSLTVASDERDKTDFTALDIGLDFVKRLLPYTYKWDKRSNYGDRYADDYDLNAQTPDGTHKEDWLDIGFKAQDVEALEVEQGYRKEDKTNLLITMTEDGKQYGMRYEKFVPVLVKAIQELSAKNDELEARLSALENA